MVCILFLLPNHLFQWCGNDFTVLNLLLNANGYPDAYSEFMSLVTCECCLCLSGQVCIRVATSFDVCDACQTVMPKSRPFGVLYVFTNPFVYLGDNEFICENREKVKMEYLPLIDISIMGMLHGVNSSFACFVIPPPASIYLSLPRWSCISFDIDQLSNILMTTTTTSIPRSLIDGTIMVFRMSAAIRKSRDTSKPLNIRTTVLCIFAGCCSLSLFLNLESIILKKDTKVITTIIMINIVIMDSRAKTVCSMIWFRSDSPMFPPDSSMIL